MMQRRSFAPGAVLNSSLLKRYVLAEALIVSIQQVFFLTLLETRPFLAHLGHVSQEDPWLLGGLRMASQAMVFVAVSFPLRKSPWHVDRSDWLTERRRTRINLNK
ncbi:unnamed protein product [Cladocopium goreaui]|uniref:Uncharacterized protein n=1 Tax=Cladocopium goreaui TaxID=2562237 RepID=A0A9P1C6E8_9DINO|nr:unnamed protein product [Cladocopium goreaui]